MQKQLSALLPQVRNYPDSVRVLVCDNASEKYAEVDVMRNHPYLENVVVRRNGGNIGANANIALGFVFARSDEFLWILSDNDIVTPNAVSYIISMLDRDIDFYCFVDNVDSARKVEHHWQDGWQIPMEWRMGLISDALYNMATVSGSVEDAFYFHNSSFPHLAVACSAAMKKSRVQFMLLPRKIICSDIHSSHEQPTDYSLAHVCMPLLVPLFPAWEARLFCKKWLQAHGVELHLNKSRHSHLYLQSRATLLHYGGWDAAALLFWKRMLAIVAGPLISIRGVVVGELKKRLSIVNLERAKRVRRMFCGK